MELKFVFFCAFIISGVMLSCCIESVITKIAYKKPIHLKEKTYGKNKKNVSIDIQTTESTLKITSKRDNLKTTILYQKDFSPKSDSPDSLETTFKVDTSTVASTKATINSACDKASCTCGVFLGSQFVKGSPEPPKGDPVISTTLERSFVCNTIGRKQCQTKCLEQIIQHLPNSAKILCASLDRDIRKEKAHLFVRNCNSKWYNTNLAAGREYCCKNGVPYNCPKK